MRSFDVIDLAVSDAIEKREFIPYFQPLVELWSGRLSGFEALARWSHPILGTVSPSEFIPLVERSGMINQFSDDLLIQASAAASLWPENFRLSFNISPLQLCDTSLVDRVSRAVDHSGFSLQRLTLEVTEISLLGDLDVTRVVAAELKSLGVQLALDDFGAGFSNLRRLQDIPFDVLKIDGEFIQLMATEKASRKIVSSVIGMAESLGMVTVAERVEERVQADMLLGLGCDFGQGYFYGQPTPEPQTCQRFASEFTDHIPLQAGATILSIANRQLRQDSRVVAGK